VVGRNGERIELGAREIYVHYGNGWQTRRQDRLAELAAKFDGPCAQASAAAIFGLEIHR
jgi:hypothetical protein